MIVIVFGLPGCGKSYLATRLADLINANYLSTDMIRKEMIKFRTYSDKEKLSVYNELLQQTIKQVLLNNDLVLDATFYQDRIRKHFIKAAGSLTAIFFIELRADESVISERSKIVRLDSDADFRVYEKIKKQWEPMDEPHLILKSANNNIEDLLRQAFDFIQLSDDRGTNKETFSNRRLS